MRPDTPLHLDAFTLWTLRTVNGKVNTQLKRRGVGGTQVGVAKVVSRAPLTAGRFKFKGETEGGEGGGVGGVGGGGGGSSSFSSSSSSSASSSAACSVAKSLFDLIELAQEEVRELPRVQKVRRERERERQREGEGERETEIHRDTERKRQR